MRSLEGGHLKADLDGRREALGVLIERIAVAAAEGGRELEVRPREVVLAAGGIETARLLLLSTSVEPMGLGNRRDLVGRYFSNHPEVEAGLLQLSRPEHATRFYASRS